MIELIVSAEESLEKEIEISLPSSISEEKLGKYGEGTIPHPPPLPTSITQEGLADEEFERKNTPLFQDAGKELGMQIWKIVKLVPIPVNIENYGKFYEGDSYIILKTAVQQATFYHDIHYWVGQKAPLDSVAAASILSVELKRMLGVTENSHHHREEQGEESDLFKSYFVQIPYKVYEGSTSGTGFKHVVKVYQSRLVEVKGTKQFRVHLVELSPDSLSSEDSYVLDAGYTIFIWHGAKAHRSTKAKTLEISAKLKTEVGCQRAVQVVDEGDDNEEFWEAIGGKYDPVRKATLVAQKKKEKEERAKEKEEGSDEEEDDDEDDEEGHFTSDWMYKISQESGKMKVNPLEETEFTKGMLKDECSYILDCETEVYLWHSKKCTAEEKATAYQLALEILTIFERPSWTTSITRVQQGSETCLFREKVLIQHFDTTINLQ